MRIELKHIVLPAAICLVLMPRTAPAPIYSFFPGLDKLINGADFIVVADIIRGPSVEERDMGGGGTFHIEVVQVLKGDVKPNKQSTAYLRDLPFVIGPRDHAEPAVGIMSGGRYMLFLNKPGTHMNLDGKPPPAEFENENCEGDAVWLGPSDASGSNYFDLELLKGKSVRESVVALLNHTATQQQKFATAVKAMIESRSVPNVLTQRVIQVVWLNRDPEEAATFYLSIFKHSAKDPNINHYVEVFPDSKTKFTGVRLWIDGQDIVLLNGVSKFKSTQCGTRDGRNAKNGQNRQRCFAARGSGSQ